jgi:hypothetical protein
LAENSAWGRIDIQHFRFFFSRHAGLDPASRAIGVVARDSGSRIEPGMTLIK